MTTDTTLTLEGLTAPVTIRVDRWGIPHLEAANEHDLFWAQGFNAARDRLWQIDLWRKRGLGLLAADFGPGYLAQDVASRLFVYRGNMADEWAAYAPDAERICTRFAAGINAYVALIDREPDRLPPEFALFGTRPARWKAEDVVRIRSHALVRNALSEVLRAAVMARADAQTDLLRRSLDPFVRPTLAPGLSPDDVPLAALDTFKLATAPVTFEPERLACRLDDAGLWTKVTELGDVVRAAQDEGSNNWVVAGSRTASGRPILASDPHRAHAVPSLRYLVHLTAPGFDAIGAGEPAAPGLSIGHNGALAFGLTIHGADQEDVYVYETQDGERYRYGDGWEAIERVDATFAVKGAPDQWRQLAYTRHGPVLHEDRSRGRLVALRTVWTEPGTAAYLGSLRAMRAKTVAAFGATLGSWGAPSVNHVCADTAGSIGWFTAGLTPLRPNWEGLLPVPGDGRYEWSGFAPFDALAGAVDPSAGFLATANELNIPDTAAIPAEKVGHEWAEPSRALRIHAVLAGQPAHTLENSGALQNDVVSLPARRLCALLPTDDPGFAPAALMRNWSHALESGSEAAALFEVWWMLHLRPALLARLCPDPALRTLLVPSDITTLLQCLEQPDARLGPDPVAQRDALLHDTLWAAWADLEQRLGPDPSQWAWGRLHHAAFDHAAAPIGAPSTWNVARRPLGGSASTAQNAGYRLSDFRCVTGASVRLVIDVGAWDNSLCVNAPGQSGDPASPHYADLAEPWSNGAYVPLLYGGESVREATAFTWTLLPAGAMATP